MTTSREGTLSSHGFDRVWVAIGGTLLSWGVVVSTVWGLLGIVNFLSLFAVIVAITFLGILSYSLYGLQTKWKDSLSSPAEGPDGSSGPHPTEAPASITKAHTEGLETIHSSASQHAQCLEYYSIVRARIASLDELSSKATLDGASFGLALLGASALLFEIASIAGAFSLVLFDVSGLFAFVSAASTGAFLVLTNFYGSLISEPLRIAKVFETHLFPNACTLRLTESIDLQSFIVGRNSWVSPTLVLSLIAGLEAAVGTFFAVHP